MDWLDSKFDELDKAIKEYVAREEDLVWSIFMSWVDYVESAEKD